MAPGPAAGGGERQDCLSGDRPAGPVLLPCKLRLDLNHELREQTAAPGKIKIEFK